MDKKTRICAEMKTCGGGEVACAVDLDGSFSELCLLVGFVVRTIARNHGKPVEAVLGNARIAAGIDPTLAMKIDKREARKQMGDLR